MKKIAILFICVFMTLTGCSSKPREPELNQSKIINDFIIAFKNHDKEGMDKLRVKEDTMYYIETSSDKEAAIYQTTKARDLTYSTFTSSNTDDHAIISIEIDNYNFGEIVKEIILESTADLVVKMENGESPQQPDLTKQMGIRFKSAKMIKYSPIVVNFIKDNGMWKIDKVENNQDFYDALSGGYFKAIGEFGDPYIPTQEEITNYLEGKEETNPKDDIDIPISNTLKLKEVFIANNYTEYSGNYRVDWTVDKIKYSMLFDIGNQNFVFSNDNGLSLYYFWNYGFWGTETCRYDFNEEAAKEGYSCTDDQIKLLSSAKDAFTSELEKLGINETDLVTNE